MSLVEGAGRTKAVFPPQFAAYLDALLRSAPFDSSPRRAELLRYLLSKSLAGEGNNLNEYAIALEALRKPDSFDPRIDSSVRSEISRLRKMISTYYEGAGSSDEWRIVFSPRGYLLQIEEATRPAEKIEPEPPVETHTVEPGHKVKSQSRVHFVVYGAALAVAAVVCLREYRVRVLRPRQPRSFVSAANATKARSEFLRGQYYWEHRTGASLQLAADAYTQAIVADSDYAPAYAGLAESYDLMPEYSAMSQTSAFGRAITTAEKSISLDPSSSVAHRALAFGLFWSQTDIPRAFTEFKLAIELAPNDAEAHHWYATALSAVQRFPEALSEIGLAQQLAPSSRSILADQAWLRYGAGERSARVSLEELEAAEADFSSPPAFLARIDLSEGNYSDYRKQLARLAFTTDNPADRRVAEAAENGWLAGGSMGMFRAIKAVQKDAFTKGQLDGFNLAQMCGMLGEKEEAVLYIEKGVASKNMLVLDILGKGWAPLLNGYPPFEALRDDVRRQFGIQ